jgi:hypothetical protein
MYNNCKQSLELAHPPTHVQSTLFKTCKIEINIFVYFYVRYVWSPGTSTNINLKF